MPRWGVGVSVLLLAAAIGLLWYPTEDPAPAPPALAVREPALVPVPHRVEPSPPSPVSGEGGAGATVSSEPMDAGFSDVTFEVFSGGQRVVGQRVELVNDAGRVSRPTDVMGLARFTLPNGRWTLEHRQLEQPMVLQLPEAAGQIRLELASVLSVRGSVRAPDGSPLPNAFVDVAGLNPRDASLRTSTDSAGLFEVQTVHQAVLLTAWDGLLRSDSHFVRAPAKDVVLTVFPQVPLQVRVWAPDGEQAPVVRVVQSFPAHVLKTRANHATAPGRAGAWVVAPPWVD